MLRIALERLVEPQVHVPHAPSARTSPSRRNAPTNPVRGVAERAPYMHAGQMATLRQVLEHYNRAPAAPAGHSELQPLHLSERELAQLEAFLRSLSAPVSAPSELVQAPRR